MVEAKTVLKGAGILVLALALLRLALWLLGVVVSAVLWAIQTAIVLIVLGALCYGGYWVYKTYVENAEEATHRETVYER